MAYNDYGAMVWRDGVIVNDTNADTRLFDDTLNGLGGMAIFAHLDEYGGYTDDMTRCYHAVLGDGDIRIGVYKGNWLIVMNNDGHMLGYAQLWEEPFIDTFNVSDKYVIERKGIGDKLYKELFTKSWLFSHRETREHTKAMSNRFGARRAWFGKDHIRQYNKHQKVRCRKRKKLSSIHADRVPKGKVLIPDNKWFTANIGGIEIHAGLDSAMREMTYRRWDENGERVDVKEVEPWEILRLAVKLDGHWWTCRVGSCYGNGWQSENSWPERMYEAVTYA